MRPTVVTITGADNHVNPSALYLIGVDFRFVEWGVLVSPGRVGRARYPTLSWQQQLAWYTARNIPPRSAFHLCGEAARETMEGMTTFIRDRQEMYTRFQVNGYVPGKVSGLRQLVERWHTRFVLQCKRESDLEQVAADAAQLPGASVLFDPSAGTGKLPTSWPKTPTGCEMGFAGGITPDNVLDVLAAIGPREGFWWIDMESGVRTDDRFDLVKVRKVLEQVASLGDEGK